MSVKFVNAAKRGDLAAVERLAEQNPTLVNAVDPRQVTLLVLAGVCVRTRFFFNNRSSKLGNCIIVGVKIKYILVN